MNHIDRGNSLEALRAKILFTQGYCKAKKIKEVEVTLGKMLPDQLSNWAQTGYESLDEEIYGANFFKLTQAMEEGLFNPLSTR